MYCVFDHVVDPDCQIFIHCPSIYLLSCVFIDTHIHFSFVVSVITMSARQEQLLQAQTMVEQLRQQAVIERQRVSVSIQG